MRDYQLRYMAEGRCVHSDRFQAGDDGEATALAGDAAGDHEAELWEGDRLVARFTAAAS